MDKRYRWTAALAATLIGGTFTLQTPAQVSDTDDSAEPIQEVLITGSRIRRESGFDYPVPVAVIGGDQLRDSGFTVLGDAMTNLPQALNTTNIQNTSGTLFNAGQSRVDLRALGSARTLVLVDGRRHLTGDFRTSAVDLNMIPSSMVDKIEAISGGASAVYGSEAISGVVNIVLRREFKGLELDFQGGTTDESDGEEWKLSGIYGRDWADGRGSLMIGAEWGQVKPIFQIDRAWAFPGIRRDTTVNPQTVVPASRSNVTPTATFQFLNAMGQTSPNLSSSIAVDRSGVFANSADCRAATVRPQCQDPWLFYTAEYNALQGELERQTWRGYADFDLTDNVTLFADLTYGSADGFAIFQPAFSSAAGGGTMAVSIGGDNAFLLGGSALANQLLSQWQATGLYSTTARANVGKFWAEFGGRNTQVFRESYRAITGIEGGFGLFGRDVRYDVYGQYSELDGFALAYNVPQVARVSQAVDSIIEAGQIVCRDVAARANGCVPWDIVNGPSDAAIAWTNANARSDGLASQTIFATNFATDLFELPAGSLGFAIGAEYREEKSDQIQDPLSASGALFYNAIGRTKGEYDLTEGYAEVVVPLLKDLPFVHRLSVEAAGRIGDYSSVGSVDQWRIAGEWAPVNDLRFRASQAFAVRAPNTTELFAPLGRNFTTAANDPCDRAQIAAITDGGQRATRIANCAAVIPGYDPDPVNGFQSNFGTGRPSLALLQGGNPGVQEEAADTFTVGLIFQPRWFEGVRLSTDYWKIEVEDAINTIPINTLLTNFCYDVPESPLSNPFCALIRRDDTGLNGGGRVGGVIEVIQNQQNVQGIETSGIDMALQFDHDFGNVGRFQSLLEGTKVIRWDLQGVPGGPITQFAGMLTGPIPEYKVNATLGWSLRSLSVQWQTRYQSSMGVSETEPVSSRDPFFTGNYWEHDLRGSFRFSDKLVFRGGIINLTDEHPPFVPEAGAGTNFTSSTYDNRGRWFYIGGNYTF